MIIAKIAVMNKDDVPHGGCEAMLPIKLNAKVVSACAFAATSVDPEPQNGSRTSSPGRMNVSTRVCSGRTGFWVGCMMLPV